MKQHLAAAVLAALSTLAVNAVAQTAPWQVRVRAVHLHPDNQSSPLGGAGAADRLAVDEKTIPELDIGYFFTPQLAAELVLTYPQKHHATLDGADIGTFRHLPPTLLAQYHFAPGAQLRPYVGAGVNYTTMSQMRLLGGAVDLERSSWGLALQAGADYQLDAHWSLNVDVKKIRIRSEVHGGGATVSYLKVDPLAVGVGLGYRF